MTERFTEAEILGALRRRYSEPGNGGSGRYAFLTHVRTGAAFDQQEMDAVVVCLWPSDNHAVLGFEVKVSRSDWRREILPDTSKSDRARRLCDLWWIVAPAGVVGAAELPVGWGLLLASRCEDGAARLRIHTYPTPRERDAAGPEPISRSFLVALLRAAGAVPGMRSGLRRSRAAEDCAEVAT